MKQLTIGIKFTNREGHSLDSYFQEIGKVDLITAEDEVNLAVRIREGDEVALEKLVKANLRFVVSVAKQYQNNSLSLGDLICEGNLGLIKAAQKFDETRGFKFISYAVWWIRQAIIQALAEQSRVVRLPLNRISSVHRITKTVSQLEQKFQRDPSTRELADELGTTVSEIEHDISISSKHISVNAPFVSGEENGLLDVLEDTEVDKPDSSLMSDSLRTEISRALATLNERESDVISCYFGLNGKSPMKLEEIGEKFGITRERVRQIKEGATRRLRHNSRSKLLVKFLG
jgi:RNA polymerase primary sigma factor